MTIQEAEKRIEEHYELAKRQKYIRNPLAYALYAVWKMADRDRE